jgi:hypothetical protein
MKMEGASRAEYMSGSDKTPKRFGAFQNLVIMVYYSHMRESFRGTLENYGEIAKGQMQEGSTPEDEKELLAGLDGYIEAAVEIRRSNPEAQERIFALQKKKQEIMARLKEDIRDLERRDVYPQKRPNARWASYNEDGRFSVKGVRDSITLGEIMTDGEWGLSYNLDPDSIPRRVREKYLVEQAKHDLRELLGEQTIIDELASATTGEGPKTAYRGRREEGSEKRGGMIAEKMVRNFLKKLSYDYAVGFEVEEADMFQDVTQHIDFIIHRKSHHRGVGVEESAEAEDIGVQFTMNDDIEKQKLKNAQLERTRKSARGFVDDVVLVTMPFREVFNAHNVWKKMRQPGGPDKLWDATTKEKIFRGVMQGIFTKDEMDGEWDKIAGGNR